MKQLFKKMKLTVLGAVFFIFTFASTGNAYGIPTYARQTGMACAVCHTVFPQLTSFGRLFKLNGYTLTGIKTIVAKSPSLKDGDKDVDLLRILSIAPVSLAIKTGVTNLAKTMPGTQNNSVEFPQSASLYYGGQISPHLGAFIQITLDGESGTFGMDMVDFRYTNNTTIGKTPLLYGVTLTNGPMMQDVWNTASPWRFPYSASGTVPTPTASPLIKGRLAGSTMGLGAYGLFNNSLYLGFSFYRSAPLGAALPPDNTSTMTIKGLSPYWRMALQHQWENSYLEVGAFGLSSKIYPTGVFGQTDNYSDIGIDLQFERPFAKGQFTLHSSYVNENQKLNAAYAVSDSQNLKNNLNSFNIDGSVFLKSGFNFTTGYFNTSGSSDNILYAPTPVFGSGSGVPNSSGIITQFDFLPWENTKLSVQYFSYGKFNGSSNNYDGFGRKASDNNALYLQLWFAF